MSPSHASWTSQDRVPPELATPRTCPMVVVTDVDGTLRDPRTRSLVPADLALSTLAARGIPVVLSAAYPPNEMVALQAELGAAHPFMCGTETEIHIPTGYFAAPAVPRSTAHTWEVIQLGPCESYVRAMRLLRSLYRSWNDQVMLIGLGDEWSDRFLLLQVDVPIIVRNDAVDQARLIEAVPRAFVTRERGPAGWAEATLGPMSPGLS